MRAVTLSLDVQGVGFAGTRRRGRSAVHMGQKKMPGITMLCRKNVEEMIFDLLRRRSPRLGERHITLEGKRAPVGVVLQGGVSPFLHAVPAHPRSASRADSGRVNRRQDKPSAEARRGRSCYQRQIREPEYDYHGSKLSRASGRCMDVCHAADRNYERIRHHSTFSRRLNRHNAVFSGGQECDQGVTSGSDDIRPKATPSALTEVAAAGPSI